MLVIRRQVYVHFILILMSKLFSTFASMKLSVRTIPPAGKTHSGTVIFFHGSGDTGSNLVEWIRFLLGKDMQFPHLKVILPTAPVQPYTPLNGEASNVWFDRTAITCEAKEARKSLATAYENVSELIQAELDQGIPANRIIVGGFSMGGSLAIHTGYHVNRDIGGVFVCSGFLNNDSIVYESLKSFDTNSDEKKTLPPLIMYHGERDSLVPCEWGKRTYDKLTSFGVQGDFITLKNATHELKTKEILEIQEWIAKLLPPLNNEFTNKL